MVKTQGETAVKVIIWRGKTLQGTWKGRINNLVLSLAARFQGVEETAYSELNMEEKVEMILM